MNNRIKDLTQIALFPALMGATAGFSIPLFNLPPITLQTFFVFLAGLILGPKKGMISMLIYLILGIIGIPVFSGFRGGLGILVGSSGGFLVGFVISAYIVGFMKNINFINNKRTNLFVILLIGTSVIYMCGASYIAYLYDMNLWLVLVGFAPYLVGDFIKIIAVVYVYVRVSSFVTYEYA